MDARSRLAQLEPAMACCSIRYSCDEDSRTNLRSAQIGRSDGLGQDAVHHRECAAIGGEPVGDLAIIIGMEDRQVGVFPRFDGAFAIAEPQRVCAVDGRGRDGLGWRHLHMRAG